MPAGSRTIYKRHDRAREEVGQLLGAVFAGELLSPSDEIWIVSPWIRDLTVLDNRAGDFSAVQPQWGLREIRLLDCLVTLLQRGATVRLKTGTEDTSVGVVRELERRANDIDSSEQLITKSSALLHTKGLLTSRCLIRGSMNFTLKGIHLNEEAVTYDVDKSAIAEMRIALDDQW